MSGEKSYRWRKKNLSEMSGGKIIFKTSWYLPSQVFSSTLLHCIEKVKDKFEVSLTTVQLYYSDFGSKNTHCYSSFMIYCQALCLVLVLVLYFLRVVQETFVEIITQCQVKLSCNHICNILSLVCLPSIVLHWSAQANHRTLVFLSLSSL